MGSPSGHRMGRRGGRWRPFGCLFLLFGLFAAGTLVVGIWAAAAIVGVVKAPPIVIGAGIVAFIVVGIAAVAAAGAFRRMTRPLDALVDASRRIERGDYTVRVPVSGGREMRSLTRAFNQMSEQLEASDARRRAFLADVTHELRTPLTVMQGQLEAIEDGVYEPDAERVASLLAHTRQMSGLVEDLHTISLAEVGGLRLELLPTDLAALNDEIVSAYAPAAQLAGIELRSDHSSDSVVVDIDGAATRRVLANLVANSMRHTPSGGTITLRSGPGESDVAGTVEVIDTGSGMDPALARRAFERFEKGPESDGSGLGLAIARDLVEAQGGTFELHSEPGHGTTVTLAFPAVGS